MRVITELNDRNLANKKVIVRGDLDLPIEKNTVTDDYRLKGVVETLRYLIQCHALPILIGHRDRPDGKVVSDLRLNPIVQKLKSLLPTTIKISKSNEVIGTKTNKLISQQQEKEVVILENIRFDPRETNNEASLAEDLAQFADLYVNECFSTSHRTHCSFVQLPQLLPAYAGIKLNQEIEVLTNIKDDPKRPLLFIVGGTKKDKIEFVKQISPIADTILLGGKLMFAEELEGVPHVMFPVDSNRIDDIGPETISLFCDKIKEAKTIVWVGPVGRFEEEEFSQGTHKLAKCIVNTNCLSVAGGGDTLAALKETGMRDGFGFISSGGGALLKFISGQELPGITALEK